jgi:hypothetical protein
MQLNQALARFCVAQMEGERQGTTFPVFLSFCSHTQQRIFSHLSGKEHSLLRSPSDLNLNPGCQFTCLALQIFHLKDGNRNTCDQNMVGLL